MVMLMLLSLGSCNSFLDIKPEGELIQDEQFKDVQGYRDAMYGIYADGPRGVIRDDDELGVRGCSCPAVRR